MSTTRNNQLLHTSYCYTQFQLWNTKVMVLSRQVRKSKSSRTVSAFFTPIITSPGTARNSLLLLLREINWLPPTTTFQHFLPNTSTFRQFARSFGNLKKVNYTRKIAPISHRRRCMVTFAHCCASNKYFSTYFTFLPLLSKQHMISELQNKQKTEKIINLLSPQWWSMTLQCYVCVCVQKISRIKFYCEKGKKQNINLPLIQ